ncbi:hypothetical protein Vi05172_g10285 [Venturia inaequalis]|nr:hypothetical protein Vi05172_g10285 [Venturia inaequalis]
MGHVTIGDAHGGGAGNDAKDYFVPLKAWTPVLQLQVIPPPTSSAPLLFIPQDFNPSNWPAMASKHDDQAPPPQYPQQAHYDAGPAQPYNNQQGAAADYYGGQQQQQPQQQQQYQQGGYPQQGHYPPQQGYPQQQQQGMYYQQQPQGGYYGDSRGGRGNTGGAVATGLRYMGEIVFQG